MFVFNWLQKMFRIHEDRIEEVVKELFRFLLDDYGFHFAKSSLGDAVDQNGEFFFYGPLDAYCIYNERICINVLYLVQRQEYDIYITDAYKRIKYILETVFRFQIVKHTILALLRLK